MASSTLEFIHLQFNHIALPPRLPGQQDAKLDVVESGLIQRLVNATKHLAHLTDPPASRDLWHTLRRSLQTCKYLNSGRRLSKASLLTAFRELQGSDFIALHVTEQNAALIIRLHENGQSVLFEAFEASPLSEDVLASKQALRWDFPGCAASIPISVYENPSFQEELATFLEKASIESIKRFAASTQKAGSFAYEYRETVDPALITQMLMTLLEVNGCRAHPFLLQKRIWDDVSWADGCARPWRRSPVWLILRVAVHRHLSIAMGGELGRLHYKFLRCSVLSQFLDDCLGQIGSDLAFHLKAKLCRRIAKLETERITASASFKSHYSRWFTALAPAFNKSTSNATEQINKSWAKFIETNQRIILTLPRHANPRHFSLRLYKSQYYIQNILYNPFPLPRRVNFQDSPPVSLPARTNFADQYFNLFKIETKIESQLLALGDLASTDTESEELCIRFARQIRDYIGTVGNAYDKNPEQKSIMLLTIMELWLAMDTCAVNIFGLLMEYSPGFPPNILDILHIPRRKDMKRVHRIRNYLESRHTACKNSMMTIFNEPVQGCFAERFYNESDAHSSLRLMHQKIEATAKHSRISKEQEWHKKTREPSTFSLASTKKSFLKTHYAHPRFPVRIEDVCLPNGLKLGYYDLRLDIWQSRLLQAQKFTFDHHFKFEIPAKSPFSTLNFLFANSLNLEEPSSYEITASQAKCPAGVNVHEYLSFQTLASGKYRRWPQILIELGSHSLNFGTDATTLLMSRLVLQMGPADMKGYLGAIHRVFRDETFCVQLVKLVDRRLDTISSNCYEGNSMETLITIAQRVFELSNSQITSATRLLEKARAITSGWISALQSEIQAADSESISQRCSHHIFWAAMLCRRTFSLYFDKSRLDPQAFRSFIECSVPFQQNMASNLSSLPLAFKIALARDFKLVYQLRYALKSSLEFSIDGLASAIDVLWPGTEKIGTRKISHLSFYPKPNQGWVRILIDATSDTVQQTMDLNLLEGHLLVMGKPIGQLPQEFRTATVLQHLFGNQELPIYPSSLPGMTYQLAFAVENHEIHLGFRKNVMFVRARTNNILLELIPPDVFGDSSGCDLPASLIDNCVHWLDLKSHKIYLRQRPRIWKTKPSDWILDFDNRVATCYGTTLIDPHSPLFHRIKQTFENFEHAHHLTAFQPRFGSLRVELRRKELSFFVNENNLLYCPQLRSEIDPNQDAGAWYGLKSKIVLREAVRVSDKASRFSSLVPLHLRSILVPIGEINYICRDPHILLFVATGGAYAKFTINEVLGRLDCAAEPLILYQKAMYHAYTSFVLPDPLTGRTGTEEALHCLNMGYCQPWTPIRAGPCGVLHQIAKLTPQREYYPQGKKVMQTTFWEPNLTTFIQHDGYWDIINTILNKSSQLSMFSLNQIHEDNRRSAGEAHLNLRSCLRRDLYQRLNCNSRTPLPIDDSYYQARDHLQLCQARENIVECLGLICLRPTRFSINQNLASLLQTWPIIGGFNKYFEKALLSELLDVQLASDWGSLVNLCRNSSLEDAYKLMFLFAIMSFAENSNTNALKILIAYYLLKDLKVILPPVYPFYNQFQHNKIPHDKFLSQILKNFRVSLPDEEFSSYLSSKMRQKLKSAQMAHERQQESCSKELSEHLLAQWPCPLPIVENFAQPNPPLIDIKKSLQIIRPEWLRLYQNLELSHYVTQVQQVLNRHLSNDPLVKKPEALELPERDIIRSSYQMITPTLKHLLSKNFMVESHDLIASQTCPKNPTRLKFGATQPKSGVSVLNKEIKDLHAIVANFADSKSLVRQQYGRDLIESLRALKAFNSIPQENQLYSGSFYQLEVDISNARKNIQNQLNQLYLCFEQDTPASWLKKGGLWPAITPIALLENLRSISSCQFGHGMKNAIFLFARSISVLQRLLRVSDAFRSGNKQRQTEEEMNIGHTNWDPKDYPDWLLLEIETNILIRPGQVDVALATISPDSRANSVLQMNMGQGKTSCIIPMSAAVLANGINLFRVVVPKALLMQTAQLLHARLGGLLGRELRHVPFSRKTPSNPTTIEAFYKIHKGILKSSGIILAQPEHLLSFKLSGVQQLSDSHISEGSLMVNVQKWLSKRARDLLDECDNILSLRTQLIYPSGTQKTVDGHPHRWEVIETLLSQVDKHLYHLHGAFPQSIEVVRREKGRFPVVYLLCKDVEDELLSLLADEIHQVQSFLLSEYSESDRILIKGFILKADPGPKVMSALSQLFYNKPAKWKILHLLRGLFVHRILLMAFKKRWNVQYGLHPNRDPIAVPYHAKGTPSDQAEWGHPDVAIIFTCLSFFYEGLNIARFRQILEHILKSDDPSQIFDRFLYNTSLPESLKDWNAINLSDELQLKELWQHLRFNTLAINYFLNNFVFPKHAKQFEVKLQASGWDIPISSATTESVRDENPNAFAISTTGFSGTNDWKKLLPLTIRQNDLSRLLHTNAEVLACLLQPRNRKYILAANNHGKHLTEKEFLCRVHQERIRVLIDAGAQILEMDNFSLVEAWLEIDEDALAAIYFDENNKPQVWSRRGHPIPLAASAFADDLSNCLVYLDEAHTRGTDLNFPTDARGALTLGLGQTKDATVQAAMRLRKLARSQSVTFFAPPEVHQSILDLCKRKKGDLVDSFDVLRWLLEQTCIGIEHLQPLYFSQGADFCRRAQAALDNPEFVSNPQQRKAYLASIRHYEQQTLEELYGLNTRAKSSNLPRKNLSPELDVFMKELHNCRKTFQDTGGAVHGSILQEVEQEREIEQEVEVEVIREQQKPKHHSPFLFPGLHRDIVSFAKTGRLLTSSIAYKQAFSYLNSTRVGKSHRINLEATSGKLFVTAEFTKTVKVLSDQPHDHYLRQVNWILWSTVAEVGLIVIPEEADRLIQLVQESKVSPTHLLTYAAPITRKMMHFNKLQFFAMPSLSSGWEAPLWLRIELGVFAGRLHFEYSEYSSLLDFLGVQQSKSGQKSDERECEATANPELGGDLMGSSEANSLIKRQAIFTKMPLDFLQKWLQVRRKGQDFAHTPMGFICQAVQLLVSHPFFVMSESNRNGPLPIKKASMFRGSGNNGLVETEVGAEAKGGFYTDEPQVHDYDATKESDNFNDDELLEENVL
ncbi:MAG: hypothetical protein M1829_000203 [Trizodia sp. TS-e1964]|nr:MAG: hypothetical protein M1829_000203 [Trizodia sp. TS-e1964]